MEDIFKKSFLEGFNSNLSFATVVTVLCVALFLGLFIFAIYRVKTKGVFYNKDFNNVLIGLPVITAAIVLSMQANIVVSLGMVGALSIVRFRNAVKSSMDLLYLFWSISIGIICGAQLYLIAFVLTAILAIVVLLFDFIPVSSNSYLIVLNMTKDANIEAIESSLKLLDRRCRCRSQISNASGISLIYEINTRKTQDLNNTVNKLDNLISYNILLNDGLNRIS